MNVDLICFSHLRWDFVYQRPQHLMSRAAVNSRIFYFEEAVFSEMPDQLQYKTVADSQLIVVTPHLCDKPDSHAIIEQTNDSRLATLLDRLIAEQHISRFISWYYAPMARAFSNHLKPLAIIYDCMDELSAFKFAPPELVFFERQLFSKADIVFTGGYKLYQAKKGFHSNIHPFPSAIDKAVFYPARTKLPEPGDQAQIPHPRLGFFGGDR